jgi:hypothetical protein
VKIGIPPDGYTGKLGYKDAPHKTVREADGPWFIGALILLFLVIGALGGAVYLLTR